MSRTDEISRIDGPRFGSARCSTRSVNVGVAMVDTEPASHLARELDFGEWGQVRVPIAVRTQPRLDVQAKMNERTALGVTLLPAT